MKWKNRNLRELAHLVCGDPAPDGVSYFRYRSSSFLTEFFEDCDLDFVHDGSTRWSWVAECLTQVLAQPQVSSTIPPDAFIRIIRALLDSADAQPGDPARGKALSKLNAVLAREGWEAFYDELRIAHLRHLPTNTVAQIANPHRPMTSAELIRKEQLTAYLNSCSEDQLIEEVLLPLFRQLGFHRVTAAGHKDKALEYGKDIWMKYTLPTLHVIYFGIQVKKGKLDSSGISKAGSANIAEIYNQVHMMLGHEIFDSELSRRVLVDHAFIVAGGEITKQARNWIGNKLDAVKRSQIMFMDRDDILNLYTVTNLSLPKSAGKESPIDDNFDVEIPF